MCRTFNEDGRHLYTINDGTYYIYVAANSIEEAEVKIKSKLSRLLRLNMCLESKSNAGKLLRQKHMNVKRGCCDETI